MGGNRKGRQPREARRRDWAGESLVALCGGALALSLLLVAGLMALLAYHGLAYFWQKPVVELELKDGTRLMGEVYDRQEIPADRLPEGISSGTRVRLKVGNRDVTGHDFVWVNEYDVARRSEPRDAVVLERMEWGNFYGRVAALQTGDHVVAEGAAQVWKTFPELHRKKREQLDAIRRMEKGPIGDVNYRIEKLQLALRKLELEDLSPEQRKARKEKIQAQIESRHEAYEQYALQLEGMRQRLVGEKLAMETAAGVRKEIPVGAVVRAIRPNALTIWGKTRLYLSRIGEFLFDEPRESNTEGGVFPAIFGTVMMVFLMAFAVSPLGVLAAVYLREYARQGVMTRIVRIAVNNLAGVPSIVFGVFGLGFFVYLVGGTLDRLFFPEALPTPTFGTGGILWASLTLALLTVPVVIVATEEGLASVPREVREGSLALGATKFETTWKVVVPGAAPGILTGMILAMARAAGEVAPLMIVGMVKLAPALPVDHHFPYFHLERKFMHLGFHVYDLGFQSPNVEAVKPLVFATALLLVLVVAAMNLVAIWIRSRLRRKYSSSAV